MKEKNLCISLVIFQETLSNVSDYSYINLTT